MLVCETSKLAQEVVNVYGAGSALKLQARLALPLRSYLPFLSVIARPSPKYTHSMARQHSQIKHTQSLEVPTGFRPSTSET